MVYENIVLGGSEDVPVIEINRPEIGNAFTPDMGDELTHILRHLISDDAVRAIILTGSGAHFCERSHPDYLVSKLRGKDGKRFGDQAFFNEFFVELSRCTIPLIAAINGHATGIGCAIALPFDIRIAASTSTFDFDFARRALVPALGATHIMQRLIGSAKTAELLFCNAVIDASEALSLGLVNHVVPRHQVMAKALEIAEQIKKSPPAAIAAMKRSLAFAAHSSLGAAIANERRENEALRETTVAIMETLDIDQENKSRSGRDLH